MTDRTSLLDMLTRAKTDCGVPVEIQQGPTEIRIYTGHDDATASFYFTPEGELNAVRVDEVNHWELS